MVAENPNDLEEVCSIIFLDAGSDLRDLYMSRHKIYGVKISHCSNFNPISIALRYKNNIKIFFLSLVMDCGK